MGSNTVAQSDHYEVLQHIGRPGSYWIMDRKSGKVVREELGLTEALAKATQLEEKIREKEAMP